MVGSKRSSFKLSRSLSLKSNKLRRLIQSEQWSLATARVQSHPKEAKRWTLQHGFYEGKINTELLPIHMACALKAPASFLEALINAHPESIEAKESRYGRVPLHLACLYRTDFESIRFLLARYASGAQVRDAVGRTPLFYACSKGLSADLILMLLSACPDAAKVADYKGWLPLHAACHVGCPDEVILGLLDAYPGSHKIKTNGGSLPKVKRGVLTDWKEGNRTMLDHVPSFTRNTSFSRQYESDDDMDNMSVHSSTSWYELQKDLSVRVIVEGTSCYV